MQHKNFSMSGNGNDSTDKPNQGGQAGGQGGNQGGGKGGQQDDDKKGM